MKLIVSRKAVASITAVLLLVPWTLGAQNSTTTTTQNNQPVNQRVNQPINQPTKEHPNPGVYSGREVFIPKTPEEKEEESGPTLFSNGFLRNTRQHIGAAVGVYEAYTPGSVLSSSGERKALAVTSVAPQLY